MGVIAPKGVTDFMCDDYSIPDHLGVAGGKAPFDVAADAICVLFLGAAKRVQVSNAPASVAPTQQVNVVARLLKAPRGIPVVSQLSQ